jgi:FkbM family methyltransferase
VDEVVGKIFNKSKRFANRLSALFKLPLSALYKLILKATEPAPNVVVNESSFGTFCGFENDYLYQLALSNGSNEPHFEEIIECLINEDSVVLDVGSNIGTHAILLSKKVKSGLVYAFEPQSLVFSILQNNLLLNNCNNVTSYRFALSDSNSSVIAMEAFSFSGERINNGAIRVDNKGGGYGDLVLTRKLDSFEFPSVDFIKMDIQGSEVKALCGAKELIHKHRPVMFIEIEQRHLEALGYSSKELIEKLLSFDYALYRIENDYPCDHLCIPLEMVDEFERTHKPKLSFTLSKILGKKVELTFLNKKSQNYETIKVVG